MPSGNYYVNNVAEKLRDLDPDELSEICHELPAPAGEMVLEAACTLRQQPDMPSAQQLSRYSIICGGPVYSSA